MTTYIDSCKEKLTEFEDKTKLILGLPFKEWKVKSATATIGIPTSSVNEDTNYNEFGKQIARALISSIIASSDIPKAEVGSVSWKNFIDEVTVMKHEENCLSEIQDCIFQNAIFPLVKIHITDTRPSNREGEKFYLSLATILNRIKVCTIHIEPMLKSTISYSFIKGLDNLQMTKYSPYERETNIFKTPYVQWVIKEIFEDFSWVPIQTKLSAIIDENIIKDTKLAKFMSAMFTNNTVSFVAAPALNVYSDTRLVTYYLGEFHMWDGVYDWETLRKTYVLTDKVHPADVIYFDHHEFDELLS